MSQEMDIHDPEYQPKTWTEVALRHPEGFIGILEKAEKLVDEEGPGMELLATRLREIYEENQRRLDLSSDMENTESETNYADDTLYFPEGWDGDYVYLVEADPGIVKIGVSSQVQRRLNNLNRSSPQNLELRAAIGVTKPQTVESWLHAELEEYHLKAEWFDVGEGNVEDLVSRIKSISSISSFGGMDESP